MLIIGIIIINNNIIIFVVFATGTIIITIIIIIRNNNKIRKNHWQNLLLSNTEDLEFIPTRYESSILYIISYNRKILQGTDN